MTETTPDDSHPFDRATRVTASAGRWRGETCDEYFAFVGPFGGATAATLLRAIMIQPERIGDPLTVTVNLCAPVANGAFDLDVRLVRATRSTQHWLVELTQDEAVVLTATAVLAQRRCTWSACDVQAPAGVPAAETIEPAPSAGRLTWVQRYDMRFIDGGVPDVLDGVEQPHASSRLWLRDEPPRPLDFAALTALCDAFFPRIFLRRRSRVPIGTVSMTVYFHADAALLAAQGTQHVLASVRGHVYRNGYFDQSAELWSADGRPLATTTQVVYYRE